MRGAAACACGVRGWALSVLGLACASQADALSAEIARVRADVDALRRELARLAELASAQSPTVRIHQPPPPR